MEHVETPWNEKIKEIETTSEKDKDINILKQYVNYLALHLNNTIERCGKLEKELNKLKK